MDESKNIYFVIGFQMITYILFVYSGSYSAWEAHRGEMDAGQ
jgi:hypothetical protein